MLGVQTDLNMSHFSAFQSMQAWGNIQEKAIDTSVAESFLSSKAARSSVSDESSDECFYSDEQYSETETDIQSHIHLCLYGKRVLAD